MFGVLVVETADGRLAFLAAYSGLLEGRNDWPYFVPPIYDAQQPDGHFKQEEHAISAMNDENQRQERRLRSQQLQLWLFDHYRLLNARGEERPLTEVWQDYHCSERIRRKYPLPPGGTGDCCAPKLLQYAYQQGLKPLCMAEFWWGSPPGVKRTGKDDTEQGLVRHHGQFYPACRGKCKPVLTWMLQGLKVDPNPEEQPGQPLPDIDIVYEDNALIVIGKPAGLLSVPGRIGNYSVATILSQRYPGALLAHRLDMGTSGLMVAGRTHDTYRQLQLQFSQHTIRKTYVALLDGTPFHPTGTITLPLLCDPINRPRQVVDYEHGKQAITDYEVLETMPGTQGTKTTTRVRLTPHTGRTHQLRMHCAHPDGLGCPIIGDELYGRAANRLYLHAETLELTHPISGERMALRLPTPF